MPSWNALARSAPAVRLVALDILSTGVLALEWALSSFRSALVHSRRLALFLVTLAFFKFIAPWNEGRSLITITAGSKLEQTSANAMILARVSDMWRVTTNPQCI